MAKLNVDAMGVMNSFTVKVHLERHNEMRIRVWFAIRLMKLASLIGGFGWGGIEETPDG